MAKTLKSLSPGDTLIVPGSNHNGVAPVLRKLADNHHATGTTLLDTRDIIDLIAFDAAEGYSKGVKGSNYYEISNIRQYLNSVGPNWYSPQHTADAPPNADNVWNGHGAYDKRNGFLSAFPSKFVEHIVTTTLTTSRPDGYGGFLDTHKDKVFLLSSMEVGLKNSLDKEEGKVIPFLKDFYSSRRPKKPTQQAIDNTTYTSTNLTTSEPWSWWLRSPIISNTDARIVQASGSSSYSSPYFTNVGVAPALNLPSDTLVSDAPNAEGHYEIILPSSIGTLKIKIGSENKEILEMYLNVNGSNKAVIETNISINGTIKPWV